MKGLKKYFFIIPLLLFLFASNTMVANDMIQGTKAIGKVKTAIKHMQKGETVAPLNFAVAKVGDPAQSSYSARADHKVKTDYANVLLELLSKGYETSAAISTAHSTLSAKYTPSVFGQYLNSARDAAIQLLSLNK